MSLLLSFVIFVSLMKRMVSMSFWGNLFGGIGTPTTERKPLARSNSSKTASRLSPRPAAENDESTVREAARDVSYCCSCCLLFLLSSTNSYCDS